MKRNSAPLISVCIPVYNTEAYLAQCLRSVIAQDFAEFEIVVVNDASCGTDERGFSCKKIVKLVQKESKRIRKEKGLSPVEITYIENQTNLQTVETRRILVEAVRGKYITMLDSDDELLPGALSDLYSAAKESQSDIVHGAMSLKACSEISQKSIEELQTGVNLQSPKLSEKQIINCFLNQEHSGYLCAKLIDREVYLRAFNHIPFTKCVMADDYLIYFFIALEAKSYISIKTTVYLYNIGLGISARTQITSLARWEQICSAANVFTVIFDEIANLPQGAFTENQMDKIRIACRHYIKNNISQLETAVSPEIHAQAYDLLCDYWGEDFVQEFSVNKI